jgi:hypothetical protein
VNRVAQTMPTTRIERAGALSNMRAPSLAPISATLTAARQRCRLNTFLRYAREPAPPIVILLIHEMHNLARAGVLLGATVSAAAASIGCSECEHCNLSSGILC